MTFVNQDIIALIMLTNHQKMLKKKLMTVMYMRNYLDDKRKSDSLDVQKLLLREIIIINDTLQDILDVYCYTICLITFLYCFVSVSLLT